MMLIHKSKIKLAVLLVVSLSVASILVHLYLANSSTGGDFIYQRPTLDDFFPIEQPSSLLQNRSSTKIWASVRSLQSLQPYAKPRYAYPAPGENSNGFIIAKIYGGFEKIHSAISDLVVVSRILNATLVIPEIQESLQSKGISSRFRSFSYVYDEEQFIRMLANDINVVHSIPDDLKEARKRKKFPLSKPDLAASPRFYIKDVLPKLKGSRVIRLAIMNGGCLQPVLPPNMADYQRLRCRVAFHALKFRHEIQALGSQIIKRLHAFRQPYLVFHPGLVRERLAFNGCAELFQDVHTELIQYRRAQMIKEGILHEELSVDSVGRKKNGSCPIMPEEVGLLLRAIGYPPNTIIYVAGAELFGGQRILIPLRAMYTNILDITSLCSKKELNDLIGQEPPLPSNLGEPPPVKSEKELIDEWKKSGPRPRPLPPPPGRPFYPHEKEGWYGWVAETDEEPDPSPADLRMQAHRLLWNALDYFVSLEADAFFPGFNNDGSRWPDFSSLVMGHRLYQSPSRITYRPDRKIIAALFDAINDNKYQPRRSWKARAREHLNKSLAEEGLRRESQRSKPTNFLAHPLPECSCRISPSNAKNVLTPNAVAGGGDSPASVGEDRCPDWMAAQDLHPVRKGISVKNDNDIEESDMEGYDPDMERPMESQNGTRAFSSKSTQVDEEMDPDD